VAKLLEKLSPKDVIELSKSMYKIRINDVWHVSEIPKKQWDFLKSLE
jgi:hypothetical protein